MTALTLFTLGRGCSIPFSTVTVAHHLIKSGVSSYVAEVLILNQWFERSLPANDIGLTIRKI